MRTYGEALAEGRAALTTRDLAGGGRDARLLLAYAAGLTMAGVIAGANAPIPDDADRAYAAALARRMRGEPVARIVGKAEFYGLDFALNEATLVPRPDTETLVETALAEASTRSPDLSICDLGTGSGAVVVALLAQLPRARAVATDISEAALAMARANAVRHGVAARIEFRRSSFGDDLGARFDIVVSNPPYIRRDEIATLQPEVSEYDPLPALDGGPDGLDAYRTILARAAYLLVPGGFLGLEVGHDQGKAVLALAGRAGLVDLALHPDLSGHGRVVAGRRNAAAAAGESLKKALGKVG